VHVIGSRPLDVAENFSGFGVGTDIYIEVFAQVGYVSVPLDSELVLHYFRVLIDSLKTMGRHPV
jgi:hypothetical protein